MKTHDTAAQAVEYSALTGEIARCSSTPQNSEWLLVRCEENLDGEEFEFWGADDEGNAWRVHIARNH